MTDYSKFNNLLIRLKSFVHARDWAQFHQPKDMAMSLSLEAGELMEHFQWKNAEEIRAHLKNRKDDVADELADVMYWVMLMSDYFDIDLASAFAAKMDKNEKKYPADKAKGSHAKYTEYV